jgi:hypothetical protein
MAAPAFRGLAETPLTVGRCWFFIEHHLLHALGFKPKFVTFGVLKGLLLTDGIILL